ncbi:MAG TPA: hypothetical protein VLZ06_01080 [Solirubrobacteraceae bacterium]|nr:hypothetical protein [Solirubrobacteraceae bacterium]
MGRVRVLAASCLTLLALTAAAAKGAIHVSGEEAALDDSESGTPFEASL